MNQNVAIDNGYHSTKIYQQFPIPKSYSFRSKMQSTTLPLIYPNTHSITYKNTTYLIGDHAEEIDINLNKNNSLLHYLTTLTGLGLLSPNTPNTQPIQYNLVANIPINLYNQSNKESFENHLRSTTPINYTLNKKPISISIPNVVVFPQCLPCIYVNHIKSNLIGILDCGGITIQGCICENKNLISSTVFTENQGILILLNKIKKTLNATYNLNINDYELESILKNGLLQNKEESLQIISSICTSHIEQIIKIMKLSGWNIENTEILCVGGGSLLLEQYLYKLLPKYRLSNNPVQDNVLGLWEVAKNVF
jgi:hypothetical protein